MKNSFRFGVALDTIKTNKFRTFLTMFLVYLMSFVVVVCSFFVLLLSTNINNAYKAVANKEGINIYISSSDKVNSFKITEVISSYSEVISYTNANYNGVNYYDYNTLNYPNFTVVSGRIPTIKDKDTGVLLEIENKDEYNLGDNFIYENKIYVVIGFYESDNLGMNPILDISNIEKLNSINIVGQYTKKTFFKDINDLNDLYKDLTKLYGDKIECNFLDMYNSINSKLVIFMIIFSLIMLVIIVLTINMISNSILVSYDQNRENIGILRALGVDKKNLYIINFLELFCITIVGFILTIASTICIYPGLKVLVTKLINIFYDDIFLNGGINIVYNKVHLIIIIVTYFILLNIFIMLRLRFTSKGLLNKTPSEMLRGIENND